MMFKRKHFILLIIGLLVGIGWLLDSQVLADNVSFGQEIQPLNCLVTKINTGTVSSYLVTPVDCSSVIPIPDNQNVPSPENNVAPSPNPNPGSYAPARIYGLKSLSGLSIDT